MARPILSREGFEMNIFLQWFDSHGRGHVEEFAGKLAKRLCESRIRELRALGVFSYRVAGWSGEVA